MSLLAYYPRSTQAFFPTQPLLDPFGVPPSASLPGTQGASLRGGSQAKGAPATCGASRSDWLLAALRALVALADLPDGWDGRYGPRPQADVLVIAAKLLMTLRNEPLGQPGIGPVPGGGIQMEWQIGSRELELEVLPDSSIEFLTVEEDRMEEGPVTLADEKVLELARWLTAAA